MRPAAVRLQPPIWLPVAAGIVALAAAGGGFSDATLGVATAVVWLLLGGLLLGGRIGFGAINRRLAWLLGSFAFLAGWAALSLGWTSDSAAGFADLVRLLLYLGVILTAGLAARPGSGPSWFAGVALGGVLVALLALGSRLFGLGGDEQIALELGPAAERLSYPIGYWNGLGYLLAMTLPALLWLALGARSSVAALAAAGSTPVATCSWYGVKPLSSRSGKNSKPLAPAGERVNTIGVGSPTSVSATRVSRELGSGAIRKATRRVGVTDTLSSPSAGKK